MRDIIGMALALAVLRVRGENISDGDCVDGKCFVFHVDSASFDAAQLVCQEKGGHLMTVRTEKAAEVLGGLLNGASGDFWLGLKHAGDRCSNSSNGLKGYRWVTGDNKTQYVNWKSDVSVCSPLCVSVSQKVLKWTERACNDRIDGYFCEYDNPSYCPTRHICFEGSAPCEHDCINTEGSYHCVCFEGFIQSTEDMNKCKMHCEKNMCPADCDPNNNAQCNCPDGFLLEEQFCVDIDECDSGYCDHACENTPGGFQCSCDEGYVLKDSTKCIREDFEGSGSSTPFDFFTPTSRSPTDKPASISAASLLGIMICIVVCIILLVCIVHCHDENFDFQQSLQLVKPIS
uniref:Thrombomodulin n=1 Tax=Cyprinus carpio TaxID=7962 RepID=A0A8C1KH20_CYPCA